MLYLYFGFISFGCIGLYLLARMAFLVE